MKIGKYSFGTGDRFAHQGEAQLEAIQKANKANIPITPVWNKSHREHTTVHTNPAETRQEADQAVKVKNWNEAYFVDADHINFSNVDHFIEAADFFTIDVADYIGKPADPEATKNFIRQHEKYVGQLSIPGIAEPFEIDHQRIEAIGNKFLYAVQQAGNIYRHIADKKGKGNFITEVSMDEVGEPQTPVEMFFILSALAQDDVPVQTIAPKFTGRFNKGVDYEGDINKFTKEFEEDLLVIDYAVKEFGLPEELKLSIHSGSDKFSIYPVMGKLIKKYNKGIHVKTAGTTWLEEVIGLAIGGGEGLALAKKIYLEGYNRIDDLCKPYASVIDIDHDKLPKPGEIQEWSTEQFVNALRHVPDHPEYNPHLRQLIHVAYKVAAELGDEYTNALKKYKDIIGREVTTNIYDRHIKGLFGIRSAGSLK